MASASTASSVSLRAFLEAKLAAVLRAEPHVAEPEAAAKRILSALETRAEAECGSSEGAELWRKTGSAAYRNKLIREYGLALCEYIARIRKREARVSSIIKTDGSITEEWAHRSLDEALEARSERVAVRRKADFILSHHARLREVSRAMGPDLAWTRATDAAPASVASLEKYADCMRTIAPKGWVRTGILWVVDSVEEFFGAMGEEDARGSRQPTTTVLERAIAREERTMRRLEASSDNDGTSSARAAVCEASLSSLRRLEDARRLRTRQRRRLRLLDVGSCYNPFSPDSLRAILNAGDTRDDRADAMFEVTALDLAPADDSVLQCDFLELEVGAPDSEPVIVPASDDSGTSKRPRLRRLPARSFDVVTLCLVLSYLPSAEQRALMVKKAIDLLRQPPEGVGLLVILTPHSINTLRCPEKEGDASTCKRLGQSSRSDTVLSRWQKSFERMGLRRWKHDTLASTYGLAYFVTGEVPPRACDDGRASEAPLPLPISQDWRSASTDD